MIRKKTDAGVPVKLQQAFGENLFVCEDAAAEYENADAKPCEPEMTVAVCDLAA